MDSAQPGFILAGRYLLRNVIGRGGMGVVWLASDELLGRDVAVKETCWPHDIGPDKRDTLRERALREARTAARLDHPNIVGVYDVVEADGRPWIVMRMVPYPPLSEVVRREGPLRPARTARIGLQILAAVRAAHAAGVMHRDIKPGNVLVGPQDRVVLTDFGMAIADGGPTLTTDGAVIGSPSYMAPERARGEPATHAADMWSLGATLYAAVEGRPPFDRRGSMAVLTAVIGDDPDPPSRAGPLWPLISALLRKNPDARPSAAETARMLQRVAAGQDVTQTLPQRAIRPVGAPLGPPRGGAPGGGPPGGEAPGGGAPGGGAQDGGPQAAAPGPAEATEPWEQTAAVATAGGGNPVPGFGRSGDEPHWEITVPPPRKPWEDAPRDRSARQPGRSLPLGPRWLLAAAAAVIVLAGGALALTLLSGGPAGHRAAGIPGTPTHQSAGGHRSHPSHGASGRQHSASPATSRPSSTPRRTPASRGPSPAPGSGASAVLPAGFSWYHDPTGFTVAVPHGWQVSHSGHYVYVRDPASGRFLIVDQTTHPKPDPLADWRQQEAARMSTFPGYHRIRLQAISYPQAQRAADWEFTYYADGQLTHVLNRNILVNSHQAYALYWSTPAAQWHASYHYFRAFATTFRPVGAPAGS